MRILQVCHKPPFPSTDGGAIAMHNLANGLTKEGCEVHVLAMNTYKQRCEPDQVPKDLDFVQNYELVEVDIKIKIVDAFINLFGNESYNISRFKSEVFESRLKSILEEKEYDVVLLESLFSTTAIPLIRGVFNGLIVLRSHNVEFNIWRNLAENESNFIKKMYLKLLTRRLKKYELQVANEVDLIAFISQDDLIVMRKIGWKGNAIHVPFGLDMAKYKLEDDSVFNRSKMSMYHVGSMNWKPHQEAFLWFFDNVWPKLRLEYSKLELHLGGIGMPKWLLEESSENVQVTKGFIEGTDYAKGKELMIVPSFSGSGIRIKIVEGMALGKVILTTTNGAMGISCNHAEHLFIADDSAEWVKIISDLLIKPELRSRIAANAREFCENNYDYRLNARLLLNKLNELQNQ